MKLLKDQSSVLRPVDYFKRFQNILENDVKMEILDYDY